MSVSVECLSGCVLFRVAFVPVAVVGRTMCFPIIATYPAKLVLASITSHVRATTIFLNANFALWTVLSVYHQVISGLRVVLTLQVPFANGAAIVRSMVRCGAQETKLSVTICAHNSFSTRLALEPNYTVALLAHCFSRLGRLCFKCEGNSWCGRDCACESNPSIGHMSARC